MIMASKERYIIYVYMTCALLYCELSDCAV